MECLLTAVGCALSDDKEPEDSNEERGGGGGRVLNPDLGVGLPLRV